MSKFRVVMEESVTVAVVVEAENLSEAVSKYMEKTEELIVMKDGIEHISSNSSVISIREVDSD